MQVNTHEAKNRLSELIQLALAGHDVVIANRGRPAVRLVPLTPAQGPRDLLAWLERNPFQPNTKKDVEAIDDQILLERKAWE